MPEIEYKEPQLQGYNEDDVEIDWLGILANILKRWKFIILISFIFGMIGVLSALTMKRKYAVTMTLAPEIQRRSSSINNITSMLGLGDISLGSNSDAMSITLFPRICQSTPFLAGLFDVELTPYLDPEDMLNGAVVKPTTVFKHVVGDDNPKNTNSKKYKNTMEEYVQYYDDSVVNISELTPRQNYVVNSLRKCISAEVDSKTGITTINVIFDDKRMVTDLADTVCRRLQQYVSGYRTRKATDDYNYYSRLTDEAKSDLVKKQAAYASRVDYDRSVILQSVNSEKERLQQEVSIANQLYSQMAQQKQMSKAKIQEEKPVYAVIQPATMPQYPMNSRKKRVLLFGFVGFFLSCLWAGVGEDLWKNIRGEVKEKIAEDKIDP